MNDEAKQKWGETDAYKEFSTKKIDAETIKGLNDIFMEFGKIKNMDIADEIAVNQVKKLKEYMTKNFFTCNNYMLLSLGNMYTEDERFTQSIDTLGGSGTAEFIQKAITYYVKNNL